MKELADKNLCWIAGLLLVSPLITMTGYYMMIGLMGTVLGIGMAGGVQNLGGALLAAASFLVPIAFLLAMWRGYYRYFVSLHGAAPPAILGSLLIAAAGWWAGTGVFLLFFESRTPQWDLLMFGALLGWLVITAVAFRRHGRLAAWTLLGAPFVLFAPLVFVIARATGY